MVHWMVFQKMWTMYHIIAFHSRNSVLWLITGHWQEKLYLFNLILYLSIFNMSCLISLLSLLDLLFLSLITFSFIPSFLLPLFFYSIFPEVTLLHIFFKYIFQVKRTPFYQLTESVFWIRYHSRMKEKMTTIEAWLEPGML